VPSSCAFSPAPSASYPTMSAISCTSVCASLDPVFADRSCESLAWRHGCVETCAFLGIFEVDMLAKCQCSRCCLSNCGRTDVLCGSLYLRSSLLYAAGD